MIRFIHCIKSKSDLTTQEFRSFWHGSAFNQLLSEISVQTGTRRICKNLKLDVDTNSQLQEERGADEPYDAILEIWFDSGSTLQPITESDEVRQLLNRMEQLQQPYIDFSASKRFFTEWTEC